MADRERWIRRHLMKLRWGQCLQRMGEWLALFLLAFGMLILLVRRLTPDLWPHVLWVGLAAVPLSFLAWRSTRRRAFTREESIALLDRTLGTGGLLMTLSERNDEQWVEYLPQLEAQWRKALPRWRPKRLASYLVLPCLFAVGVCFVPLKKLEAVAESPRTAGQRATQRLDRFLTALEEADLLPEKEKKALREQIDQLVEETKQSPLTHEKWETVDTLEQRLRMELNRSMFETDQLDAGAKLLADALISTASQSLSDEQKAQLEEEFLETLVKKMNRQLSRSSDGGETGRLKDLLQRLTKNGTQRPQLPSDPGEREQLLKELQDYLKQEQEKLSQLRQECQACLGEGGCEKCGESNCSGGCHKPGRGGVNRGRGDAKLTWGEESDEQGIRFKSVVLPPGFLEDPKEDIIEMRLANPDVNPADAAPRNAARAAGPATSGETVSRKLRPRHQKVVKQYFDTPSVKRTESSPGPSPKGTSDEPL